MNENQIYDILKSDRNFKAESGLWGKIKDKITEMYGETALNRPKRIPVYQLGLAASLALVLVTGVFVLPRVLNNFSADKNLIKSTSYVKSAAVYNTVSSESSASQVLTYASVMVSQASSSAVSQASISKTSASSKTNSSSTAKATQEPAMPAQGSAIRDYYQYKDGYYKVEYPQTNSESTSAFNLIQGDIISNLGGNIYEIKDCDPSKTVAVFDGRYYYKADFVCKTGFSYNNLDYVLSDDIVESGSLGNQLGQAGSYIAYSLSGIDPEEEIAVEFNKETKEYRIAYQLPSSIRFQGIDYYPGGDAALDFSSESLNQVGSAGKYNIFSPYTENDVKRITVKFGSKVTTAIAFTPSAQKPPASWYGSPQESMYPINEDIEWNDYDYQLSSSFDYIGSQQELKSKIGKKLGEYQYPGDDTHTYGIYEITGVNSKQSIAVKNNLMYIQYDFAFDERVMFNGKNYLIQMGGFTGTRGGKIGKTADGNEVDSVVNVDPGKEIIVIIDGSTHEALRN